MNGKVFAAFVSGLVTGAAGTFYFVRKYYKKKADAEVEEARQTFRKMSRENRGFEKYIGVQKTIELSKEEDEDQSNFFDDESALINKTIPVIEKDDIKFDLNVSYRDILERCHYDCSSEEISQMIWEGRHNPDQKIIEDSEFGDMCEPISLTWLLDDILVDELTGFMFCGDEAEDLIGTQAIDILKKHSEDEVYIRNYQLGLDIEVVFNRDQDSDTFMIMNRRTEED